MSHGGNIWQGKGPEYWQDHSANIRPEGAPDWVRTAVMRSMGNMIYYPEPDGLRAAGGIARYLGIDPRNVIATAGGISAIDMGVELAENGILLLAPCFTEYAAQAAVHGIKVKSVSIMRPNRSFDLRMAYDHLYESCCVWLCNPMNPSGTAFGRDAILELLERIEALHGRLVIDEAFIDYCRDRSSYDLISEHPALVILGSMTKSLGIPGVRLGYVCADASLLEQLRKYRRPWEINCFAESIAMELPMHSDELKVDAYRNQLRREEMAAGLKALGIFVYDSAADFLLCRFDKQVRIYVEALRECGILVRECMDYDVINDGYHLRLAVKTEKENCRLLEEIRRILGCAENR